MSTQHKQHHPTAAAPSQPPAAGPYVDTAHPQHNITAAQLDKALGNPAFQQKWRVRLAVFDGSGNVINGSNVTETALYGLDTAQGTNILNGTEGITHILSNPPIDGAPVALQISATDDGSDPTSWVWASDYQ